MKQSELLPAPPAEKKYPDAPGYAKGRATSKRAAVAVTKLSERSLAVLDALKQKPMTDHELAQQLGLAMCQVQPRRSELTAKNLIQDSGITRQTPYGRDAVVWVGGDEEKRK